MPKTGIIDLLVISPVTSKLAFTDKSFIYAFFHILLALPKVKVLFIEGIIDTTNSGNVVASARSESNGLTVTAKAGSVVFYQQLT